MPGMSAPRLPGSSLLRDLRNRGFLLPILLVVVTGALLVQGLLHRGADGAAEPSVPAPLPSAAPFRPELEKIPLTYFSDYWLQLAERTQGGIVTLGRARVPAVRVRPAYALATVADADRVAAEPAEATEGRLVAADAREGLALFSLSADAQAEPLLPATGLHAGTLVAAVSLDPALGAQIAPGHLVSAPSDAGEVLHVAGARQPSSGIAAIVDLDARLVGVAVRTEDDLRVLSVSGIGILTDRLAGSPVCRGLAVARLPEPVGKALRAPGGVVVQTVWPESFPSPPDLRAGDVLLTWAGEDLSAPGDFSAAYDALEPGQRVRYTLLRGEQRLTRELEMPGRDGRPAAMTPREVPHLGAVAQWTRGRDGEPGVRLLAVPDDGPAGRSGLQAGDVILAVDGRPLAWPEARLFLDRAAGARRNPVLRVRRGEAVRLVALAGTDEE